MDFWIAFLVNTVVVLVMLGIMAVASLYMKPKFIFGALFINLAIGFATIFYAIGKTSVWIWLLVISFGIGFAMPIAGFVTILISQNFILTNDYNRRQVPVFFK